MTTITDTVTGAISPICRMYRVQDGEARLFVGRDRKIWIGYGEEPERFAHAGDLPAGEPITKSAACHAANTW